MIALPVAGPLSRLRFERSADWLAAALAASLPWSTSATSILAALWLLALLPTLDVTSLRRTFAMPAAWLPVALFVLAALGLAWGGNLPWDERVASLAQFAKLLAIPLLLFQFSRSDHGGWALKAFFASATVLLVYSWLVLVFSDLPSRGFPRGVPVKDYVIQSGIFALCALVLLDRAVTASRCEQWRHALGMAALGGVFLLNVAFVATARTTLVTLAVLLALLGLRHFTRLQLLVFFTSVVLCAALAWTSSPYLRERVVHIPAEIEASDPSADTSVGARLYFWRQSVAFIAGAPLIGHGTGSIREMFRRSAADPAREQASNPHNQIFAVGIQLGCVGIAVLVALWAAHMWLFVGVGALEWIGLAVVVQNVVGSLFNSHLFDFTHGWLYVLGVGIVGGMVIRRRAQTKL